jgi:predicted ferric reductase
MSQDTKPTKDTIDSIPQAARGQDVLIILLVIFAAVFFVINLLPQWLPALTSSATGSAPKVYWFLSRGSAIAAYWLLWLSVAMGIGITNKMARVWPGMLPAGEIHQFTSLLGLAFALFHGLILTGDAYINISIVQVLIPFAAQSYRPTWVGIGQVVFYVWALIVLSFYVRKRIGKKAWRIFHYSGYLCFLGVMVHSIFSGTDTVTIWSQYIYWFSGASLLLLTVYRVLISLYPPKNEKVNQLSENI